MVFDAAQEASLEALVSLLGDRAQLAGASPSVAAAARGAAQARAQAASRRLPLLPARSD